MVPEKTKPGESVMWLVLAVVVIVLVLAALAHAQPAIALPPAVARPPVQASNYEDALAEARAARKPFIVFVGIKRRDVAGCVTVGVAELQRNGAMQSQAVVVSPDGRSAVWLPANASDATIRQAAGLGVSRQASPFRRLLFGEVGTARHDDERARRSWRRLLQRLPFLAEMTPYESAKNTQAIYQTRNVGDAFFRRAIDAVPRTALERKWQVPGGLESVHGWESVLLKRVPVGGRQYVADIGVRNSSGYIQYEHGWRREYPDGTVFADVLAADGEPFEVRVAEKDAGVWNRYVVYRNVAARPAGYQPVRGCVACHAEAGTGAYGAGLVPGGDTVISDPFGAIR